MEFDPGVTVNTHRYKEILRCLRNSTHGKHPEHWSRKNWLLLQDNAFTHLSVLVQEELEKQQVTILPYFPYSPDLTPYDFFSFPP
jgi:hypothetical protein